MDVADRGGGLAGVLRRCVNLGWVGNVDQMVRNAPSRLEGHLIRADVEAAVDGGRIAVDDLAVVPLGQRQPECALSRGGRTEHSEHTWLHRLMISASSGAETGES